MKTVANSHVEPEETVRKIIEACADCDCCRFLMDEVCRMFPRLYRLWDREKETGEPPSPEELRALANLCNFCALCPCPNIRADLIEAKAGFVARDGLGVGIRVLEHVEGLSKICGAFPSLTNKLTGNRMISGILKKSFGVHPQRRMPQYPDKSFDEFVRRKGLDRKDPAGAARKVAYFAGCTARFLFPEVARAAVEILLMSGVHVHVPKQKCCGMPSFLEGDRRLTLSFARENLDNLYALADEGYEILCSCPTCGFMFKNMLKEGACFSKEMQELFGGDSKFFKVPSRMSSHKHVSRQFDFLDKKIYSKILKDEGYFSCLSPKKRVLVSEKTYDSGEYLSNLFEAGVFKAKFEALDLSMTYYSPCHLREQEIGSPYVKILESIPGVRLETITDDLYCCGMGGIMGFKKDFHEESLRVGERLTKKIEELKTELIVTDCLSCRLQFHQTTVFKVRHPIEIVGKALAIS